MSFSSSYFPQAARRDPTDPVLRERDQKLESLKAVVGKLAHDFNNFLAPQYGYLTMLKDEAPSGSTIAMYLNAMGVAAQKAEGYITSILLGMRPYRQFSPREFPLHSVVAEMLAQWSADTPPGKAVSVRSDLQEFTYCGDEKQWRTAIQHLLSNARFALAMGGELEVTLARKRVPGREVERLGVPTDDLYCLRFRDTGFGMTPETLQRAFEPFFTTRTQIKAAGLGLTIVHGITLFHGGQIELQSVEDQGAIVTLWIPAAPPLQTSGVSSGLLPKNSRRRVLLIEDDPLIKEVLRTWLARHELDIETATNQNEARRSLERSKGECVLVFVEADLQSGPGEDLYAALSREYPSPAWVFLTGSRVPQFVRDERREEPLVIKKPFSHNAFSDLVRKYTTQ